MQLLLLLRLAIRVRQLSPKAPIRPLLAPWYRLVGDGDRLLLEHGRSVVVLEGGAVGTLLPALLPLLDGTRTLDEIAERVGEAARPAVERALELLHANGLVVEGPDAGGGASAVRSLAASYGLAPSVAAKRLGGATVGVAGSSPSGAEVARLLQAAGVGEVRRLSWHDESQVDLAVVAPAPDEAAELLGWNRHALDSGARWLALRPHDGLITAVGPLFVPGESCCFECMLVRLSGHVEYGSDFFTVEAAPIAASGGGPLEAMAVALVAHLALGWIGGADTRLPGILHVLESHPVVSLSPHAVLRVPRCAACSSVQRIGRALPWHEAQAA